MVTTVNRSQKVDYGNTNTKLKPIGQINPLPDPIDEYYLCQKICFANKFPKIINRVITVKATGAKKTIDIYLKQAVVDALIMSENWAFSHHWRYKPEVSYKMYGKNRLGKSEPTPIMDGNHPEWLYWKVRAEVIKDGKNYKGAVARPDLIIVRDKDNINLSRSNILRVVELKFGKDKLTPTAERFYKEIGGGRHTLTLIHDSDCKCSARETPDPKKAPVYSPAAHPAVWFSDARLPVAVSAPVPVPVSNPRPVEVPNNEGGTDWVWPLLIVAGVVVAVICLPVEIPAAIGAAVMAGITWAIETGAAYVIASSAALATRFSPQALQMINAAAK